MRNAFVSGGTGGIGRAVVRRLAESGYHVIFGYRNAEAERAALETAYGAEGLRADFADPASLTALCETLRARRIDVLVNNAGIAPTGLLQDMPAAKIEQTIAVDLTAAIRLTQAVLPRMISAKFGRIVQISSVWGVVGGSCETVYSAAKAGLIGFAKALAKEVGPSGITVNAVAPGCIDTPMLGGFDAETLRALADASAVGRLGTPDDVAAAVLYLVGDDASFVTGQVLGVDGGFF